MEQKAWVIYLKSGILLSKKAYADWRAVQAEYQDAFITVLEPMCCEDVIAYFDDEYPNRAFPSAQKIMDFFAGDAAVMRA